MNCYIKDQKGLSTIRSGEYQTSNSLHRYNSSFSDARMAIRNISVTRKKMFSLVLSETHKGLKTGLMYKSSSYYISII